MDFTNLRKFVKGWFCFKNYSLAGFHELPDNVLVVLKKTGKTGQCPKCGRPRQRIESQYTRKIRDCDFGGKKCYIELPTRVIYCTCGYRGIEAFDFVDKSSSNTKRFEESVSLLCARMTIKDVATVCRIGWQTVKDIDKRALSKLIIGLEKISPNGIGVDEVAHEKGHKYLTIVRETEGNRVIWIGDGRKKEVLDSFFTELGPEKTAKITVAVMDMWDPYIASVKEHCLNADIVFDKFHVSKKVNGALDSIRKFEFSKAAPALKKDMKHKRFIILGRRKNLKPHQEETIEYLKDTNTHLYEAYLLKEQVLDIFDELDPLVAMRRLIRWFANVRQVKMTAFDAVINTIQHYLYGIMNYFSSWP